jgi:protein-S-isoprenylcysteine O-methyltransferase Ste14
MDRVRHRRRYFLYPILFTTLLFAEPLELYSRYADWLLNAAGLSIASAGQALRLWASATEPASDGIRVHGPYAFIRHPLYAGNYLIALGLLVVFNAPLAYLIVLPSLGLLYAYVAAREERKLEAKLGEPYRRYSAAVPRFLPRACARGGRPPPQYNWSRAWQREQESICALVPGAIGLEFYENLRLHGLAEAGKALAYSALLLLLATIALAFHLRKRKAREPRSRP